MRRIALLLALAAAAPAAAQSAPALSADEIDERCAIWASAMVATAAPEDAQASQGLGYTMTWFIGRYEGRTGRKLDESWNTTAVDAVVADMAGHAELCLPLMEDLGARLTSWGEAIGTYGAELDAEAAAGGK